MNNYENLSNLIGECNRLEEKFFGRLVQDDVPQEVKKLWNKWAEARNKHRELQGQMLGVEIIDEE